MNKKAWAVILFLLAISQWFFPQWNGVFFDPVDISIGEGRIVSSIFFVGALILWYWKDVENLVGVFFSCLYKFHIMFFKNRLKEIEKELLKNQKHISNSDENNSYYGVYGVIENSVTESQIKAIKSRNKVLETERQFILDRRNSWKNKLFLIAALIVISAVITYILSWFVPKT